MIIRAAQEITSICADFLVVDAVLQNPSLMPKFPANREKNRDFCEICASRRFPISNSDLESVAYRQIP
jgi:hypothetical protein